MVRVNFLIFGYRSLCVSPEDINSVVTKLLGRGICASVDSSGKIFISEKSYPEAKKLLDGKIEYSASETLGLLGYIKRINCKGGLIAGGIISVFLWLFLGNLVWDIRIDGNSGISDSEIRATLSECGLDIGKSWFLIDRSDIETEFLQSSEKLAWININRRGTVAYIEVIEAEQHYSEDLDIKNKYANIVASESCVIEEISVKRGVAMVKAGDAVKAGDILISGVTESGFCLAEGSVVGRLSDTLAVDVSRSYEKRSEIGTELVEYKINIFNFPVNILKRYGNSYSDCDIIENVKVFSLFGGAPLPISVTQKTAVCYKTEKAEYSDEELVSLASVRLRSLILSALCSSDLLKIKTSGEYTEDGYTMKSEIVYLAEIGKTLEFIVGR